MDRYSISVVVAAVLAVGLPDPTLAGGPYITRKPTTADWAALAKLPDFSGVWEVPMGPPPKSATPKAAPPKLAKASGDVRDAPFELPDFMAVPKLKLTTAYEARRKLNAATTQDSPMANCVPPGMPMMMIQPYPLEFLVTPGKVTIIAEALMQVRHIYTDGRPLPEDPDPAYNGHSVGRWEKGALVVETIGLNTATQISQDVEHGPNLKIVERFWLSDPDTMVIDRTVTDPDALAESWKSRLTVKRHREYTITEYICQQNNRNFVTPDGKAGINIHNP
jgi:hypothetical protein